MGATYLTGLALLLALLLGWVAVQRAWAREFRGDGAEPDALAGRPSCAGGACEKVCERRLCEGADACEEESP
jgi:hypothetical protein